MTTEVKISCDGLNCHNELDNNGTSDDVQQLLEFHDWHTDPTTDEYHYCKTCWPIVVAKIEQAEIVQAEYDDMLAKGELTRIECENVGDNNGFFELSIDKLGEA